MILDGMRDIEEGRVVSHANIVATLRERTKASRKRLDVAEGRHKEHSAFMAELRKTYMKTRKRG